MYVQINIGRASLMPLNDPTRGYAAREGIEAQVRLRKQMITAKVKTVQQPAMPAGFRTVKFFMNIRGVAREATAEKRRKCVWGGGQSEKKVEEAQQVVGDVDVDVDVDVDDGT